MKVTRFLLSAVILVAGASYSPAWNPIFVLDGEPLRWDGASAVVWNPDGGGLGCAGTPTVCKLSNPAATAMVADELAKWQSVPTTTIGYSQGGQIIDPGTANPTDVTSANYGDVINADNGQNPIIYDNDRDIFDMLGTPSGVVGFAGILRSNGTRITKGYAVLQGDWFDDEPQGTPPSDPGEVSEIRFRGMMVHEFGHFNGLGHSSVNHEVGSLPGCPGPTDAQIETMSPFLTSDALSLEHDDSVAISEMYPSPNWATDFGVVRGNLLSRNGSPLRAGNVILRPDTTACDVLYDRGQGMQPGSYPSGSGGISGFVFAGLDPASGYTVRVTTIEDGGGYPISTGPLEGPDDAYNGADEDWYNPPDDPTVASVVTTGAAGTTLDGIDVRINNVASPGEVQDGLIVSKFDGNTPLDPVEQRIDDDDVDSADGFLGTAQAVWINRFTPDASELPLRVERIDILTWHPSVEVGRAIRLVVYHDPDSTGNPDNSTLVYTEDVTIQTVSTVSFNVYPLASPVSVATGEYYVGAFDLVADEADTLIESSDNDTASGRSWDKANSTDPGGFGQRADRTWMIRAFTATVPPAGSVTLQWDPSCNLGSLLDQDYAVYEGSLASLAGTPDHAPISCGTGRTLEQTVIDPGPDGYWLVSPWLTNREGSLGTGTGGTSRDPAGASCRAINPGPCP